VDHGSTGKQAIERIVRVFGGMALVAGLAAGLTVRGATASPATAVTLSERPIDGVTLETLAAIDEQEFRFHVDGIELSRIALACGQMSGAVTGAEQLYFVEWGRVEVRDWATDAVVAELTAGGAYGGDERPVYLIATAGTWASVLRFRIGGVLGGADPEPRYKDVTLDATECASGAGGTLPAKPGTETILARYPDAAKPTVPADAFTVFVGLLTVQPGAAIGRVAGGASYTANGPLVVIPLVGGFGDGQELPGITVSNFGPETVAIVASASGKPIALEDAGAFPVTALVVGAVPVGAPVVSTAD
jgi:hypothetical protein